MKRFQVSLNIFTFNPSTLSSLVVKQKENKNNAIVYHNCFNYNANLYNSSSDLLLAAFSCYI